MRSAFHLFTHAALLMTLAGCGAPSERLSPPGAGLPSTAPNPPTYTKLADMLDRHLHEGLLAKFYPRCVDRTHGGFHERLARDWTVLPEDGKFLVYQARLTWVAAVAAMYDPRLKQEYVPYAIHGLDFLEKVMKDPEAGGLYWQVDLAGRPRPPFADEKNAYGLSFGIYAGATVYAATKEARALGLAMETFRWLDEHGHDAAHGGYFEAFARYGTPIVAPRQDVSPPRWRDGLGTPYGYKSMNTHIHLLEALTALYRVLPEERVRVRLEELLALVRDKIAVAPGCLNYYFTADWRPAPMHDSFGHDVEAAYLMVEAAEALGRPDDEATWRVARSLVDHALAYGWDEKNGGFFSEGQAFGPANDRTKIWWVQAEGLNALLLMHQKFGHQDPRYWQAFIRQLQFIWAYQIDHQYGGWYNELTEEGRLKSSADKATPWKCAYHDGRALMNVVTRLRELASRQGGKGAVRL
ncbi:MAG: AGE family epimerase/isomerase [Planctomycetota bacterium]|nr:AGE family epimerase/isomerase [Planctomycetota bacterium]